MQFFKGIHLAQSVFPVQFSFPMVEYMQTKNNVVSNGQVTTIRGVKTLCCIMAPSLMKFSVMYDCRIILLDLHHFKAPGHK